MKDLENFLNNLLKVDDKVVLACSTGPDSMFLLYKLLELQKEIKFDIIVAHMNHKVRKESEEEALYIKDFCKKHNLLFEYFELNETINSNFHSKSRIIRYKFLEDVIKKYNAKYLMTAHHGDDLIETILMRIERGSNLKGYSGFELLTDKNYYKLVRPLIFLTKEEIKNYMDLNNYKYYIDKTNLEDDFLRNRYRNHILPLLKKEYKDIHKKYFKYSQKLLDANNFIESYVNKVVGVIYKDNTLDIIKFKKEELYIQKCIIEYILSTIYIDDLYEVNDQNVNEIIKIIYSNKPSISIQLPKKHEIKKSYNNLIVDKKEVINKKINSINFYEDNLYTIKKLDKSSDNSNYTIKLNSKELSMPLKIRYKKEKDKMLVKNSTGHKKVKDIFIDAKIDLSLRDTYPLLVDNNDEILWIPGIKKSNYDKKDIENYDLVYTFQKK